MVRSVERFAAAPRIMQMYRLSTHEVTSIGRAQETKGGFPSTTVMNLKSIAAKAMVRKKPAKNFELFRREDVEPRSLPGRNTNGYRICPNEVKSDLEKHSKGIILRSSSIPSLILSIQL